MSQKKQTNGDSKPKKEFTRRPIHERIYGCNIKLGSPGSGISVAGILSGNYRSARAHHTNGSIGHKGGLHRG